MPYNTKFTVNLISNRVNNRLSDNNENNANISESKELESNYHTTNTNNVQSQHMTVHSAPLSIINKNIATPLNQSDLIARKVSDSKEQNFNTAQTLNSHLNENSQNSDGNIDLKYNLQHNIKSSSDQIVNHSAPTTNTSALYQVTDFIFEITTSVIKYCYRNQSAVLHQHLFIIRENFQIYTKHHRLRYNL